MSLEDNTLGVGFATVRGRSRYTTRRRKTKTSLEMCSTPQQLRFTITYQFYKCALGLLHASDHTTGPDARLLALPQPKNVW